MSVNDAINSELSYRIGRVIGNLRVMTKAAESIPDPELERRIKEVRQTMFNIQAYARKHYGIAIGAKTPD